MSNRALRAERLPIPGDWDIAPIGDCLREEVRPASMNNSELYQLISVRRNYGGLFYRTPLFGRQILTKTLRSVIPGSFIIARRQIVHGACAFVEAEFEGSVVSNSYSSFVGTHKCDPKYFSWLAQHPLLRDYFLSSSHGIVIEKMNFDQDRWLTLPIPLPPLREQRKIVEILDALDESIRSTERLIAKLEAVRSGLIGGLLGSSATRSWKKGLVEDWGEVTLGRQRSPGSERGSGMTPYLRVANVFDGWIDFTDVHSMNFNPVERRKFFLKKGDLLLNEGQSLDLVGRCAKYEGADDKYCFQNTLVRYRCGGQLLPDFAYLTFSWWLRTGRFMAVANQTTSIAHLGADRFAKMRMMVPRIAVQEHICSVLDADKTRHVAAATKLTKLRKVKQGLLEDLLTGRVRVKVG